MYYNYRTYNITRSARVIIIAQDQAVCTCVIITARTGSGGLYVCYNYRTHRIRRSVRVMIIARTRSDGLYVCYNYSTQWIRRSVRVL